ncbi:MAG: RNA polymerase sigma-54 factor, partial [Paracoccaceae bacterium]
MTSRNRIRIEQSQRLSLNTRLVASIRLISTDAIGLSRFLEEAAEKNPQLVIAPPPLADWLPRWASAFARAGAGVPVDSLPDTRSPGLMAHVSAAVAVLRLTAAERQVAEVFVDALEPSGWLGRPLADIAREAGVPPGVAELVLSRLQRVEPTGLFARNLAECLALQAAEEGWLDPLARAVLDRLPLVAASRTDRIAADLGVSEVAVQGVVRRLRTLDPKPGARFGPCDAPIRTPDLIARKSPAGWEVSLNGSALPTLALAEERGPGRAEARSLIRLVEGRNAT